MKVAQILVKNFLQFVIENEWDAPSTQLMDGPTIAKRFRAVAHETNILVAQLDKMESDGIIAIMNANTIGNHLGFNFYNHNGMIEAQHVFLKDISNNISDERRNYISKIVQKINTLFKEEKNLREMLHNPKEPYTWSHK